MKNFYWHTSHNTNRKAKSSIAAVESIELFKSNLHILYWVKPVVVHDVVLPMDVVGSTMDKRRLHVKRVRNKFVEYITSTMVKIVYDKQI